MEMAPNKSLGSKMRLGRSSRSPHLLVFLLCRKAPQKICHRPTNERRPNNLINGSQHPASRPSALSRGHDHFSTRILFLCAQCMSIQSKSFGLRNVTYSHIDVTDTVSNNVIRSRTAKSIITSRNSSQVHTGAFLCTTLDDRRPSSPGLQTLQSAVPRMHPAIWHEVPDSIEMEASVISTWQIMWQLVAAVSAIHVYCVPEMQIHAFENPCV